MQNRDMLLVLLMLILTELFIIIHQYITINGYKSMESTRTEIRTQIIDNIPVELPKNIEEVIEVKELEVM